LKPSPPLAVKTTVNGKFDLIAAKQEDKPMAHRGLVSLPPTSVDLAVSRACARAATPGIERTLGVLTWVADEKVVLGAAAAFWLYARLRKRNPKMVREADRMLCSVAAAGALPHAFKRLVDRERPDRAVVRDPRHGIPRSGNAWDSFPSGHALHLGAAAGSIARLVPPPARPFVWPATLALASLRIMLLAHYLTDVAAGLAIGAGVNQATARLPMRRRRIADPQGEPGSSRAARSPIRDR
jgi:membrane-associated phospholipid phosphatase